MPRVAVVAETWGVNVAVGGTKPNKSPPRHTLSIYEAPGAKNGLIRGASNMLSNISIRGLLTPLLDAFACEVLGIPAPDSNAKAQLETVVSAYEKQYSWWQSAETNASTVRPSPTPTSCPRPRPCLRPCTLSCPVHPHAHAHIHTCGHSCSLTS
mmetsp:Transcript_43295/g.117268  ORF Transcript_43295/g.117268 Transcript_43295/m.117268 type:complete len:154 (+) Transcript_43295:194-655(+)